MKTAKLLLAALVSFSSLSFASCTFTDSISAEESSSSPAEEKAKTITLAKSYLEMEVGADEKINATILGFSATPTVTVSSNHSTIAVGSYNSGILTVSGLTAGTCVLTVTAFLDSASVSATLSVKVKDVQVITTYRIKPVTSTDGSSANIYQVKYYTATSSYKATVYKTLTKSSYYTDPSEVAFYYQAFKAYPKNYVNYHNESYDGYSDVDDKKAEAYNAYGTKARLWTTYKGNFGYTQSFPSLFTYTYMEADIALNSSYASGTTFSRGVGRLVVVPSGARCYGSVPIIFKTEDHYASFQEFLNCYNDTLNAFGPLFDGEGSKGYGAFQEASTVTYSL
jgi:hypothetical protein